MTLTMTSSRPALLLLLLLVACTNVDGKPARAAGDATTSAGTLSATLNGTPDRFDARTRARYSDHGSLLIISGFTEDDSLSPMLELQLAVQDGRIGPGTYHLEADHDPRIAARYTIGRPQDGAVISNTEFETPADGQPTDLVITIASVADGRVIGTFSGVVVTGDEVTISPRITITRGTFDVRTQSE